MSISPDQLLPLVESFPKSRPRIMLIGDVMVDEYIYGDAERLSPEAPVPVVQERYREQLAGGAGNVAAGLATLGAQVLCVSACGDDRQGQLLLDLFAKMAVNTDGILRCPDRPTTSKTRLVGLAQHRHPQQMLRLDNEITRPLTPEQEQKILGIVRRELPTCAALALEDYNKGLLSDSLCRDIIAIARRLKKPVLVDPALLSDYSKYDGASTITPNRFEAEKATGMRLTATPPATATLPTAAQTTPGDESANTPPELAKTLLEKHHLLTCLLTLDRLGMYLLDTSAGPSTPPIGTPIPTKPRNVYDVTGAGDMVLATMTMAIACGATWLQAAFLANLAGGLEVEKFGIVPIRPDELIDELHRLDTDAGKTRTLSQLLKDLERHRRFTNTEQGGHAPQKIVFTNGVFDILHAGHVQYLQFAKAQGDILIVAVNTDDSVKRLKGPSRPINPLPDRLTILAALQCVDYVIPFDQDTPQSLIEAILPNVLVKGEDYSNKEVVGRQTVETHGGKVILAPFLKGRSTTEIITKTSKPK